MHTLNIRIEDSLDLSTFVVKDISSMDSLLPVNTPILEILAPGSVNPKIFENLVPGFNKSVNTNSLSLNSLNTSGYIALPDGAYTIRYSVAPNLHTFIKYYYFRNIKQQNYFYTEVLKIISNQKYYSIKEYSDIKKEILWIRELIIASKFMAEDKQDVSKANDMYKEINNLINKISNCE